MKNSLILTSVLLIMLGNISTNAQEWAPEGAKWHYNETYVFAPDTGYIFYESIGDTVINDQPCKRVEKNHSLQYMLRDEDKEFMFSRNDTVFVYDEYVGEFQILYDFNAEGGDTWYRLIPDFSEGVDTAYVHIDSTTTVDINGVNLKKLFATFSMVYHDDYIDDLTYNGTITERIGYEDYMFYSTPISYFTYDMNFASGLRCYEDEIVGLYETGIVESCTYTSEGTGTDRSLPKASSLKIYPNPVSKQLWIKGKTNFPIRYSLKSVNGKVVMEGILQQGQRIDMNEIGKGIYILTTSDEGRIISQDKIIKL